MRIQIAAVLAFASIVVASPSWEALQQWKDSSAGKNAPHHTSPRPTITCHPKHPTKPMPSSPPRTKVCYVESHDDGTTDDSPYILEALHECNNGGHAIFTQGTTYIIGTAMNLTFLEHIDIGQCIFTMCYMFQSI